MKTSAKIRTAMILILCAFVSVSCYAQTLVCDGNIFYEADIPQLSDSDREAQNGYDEIDSYILNDLARNKKHYDWFTNVIEHVDLPKCDIFQGLFFLGDALKGACGEDFSVSLDFMPPKVSFFVSDAAAALTNSISAEINSLLAWDSSATSNTPPSFGIAGKFPWTPAIVDFGGLATRYVPAISVFEMFGECFQKEVDPHANGVAFRVYPRELHVVEYAHRFGNGICSCSSFSSAFTGSAKAYMITRPDLPDRCFIVAVPKTHLDAWNFLRMRMELLKREDDVAPAWIVEIERLNALKEKAKATAAAQ